MRFVVNVAVANEVELLPSFIEHHRALGVDGFVITDVQSDDGTTDLVREFARDDDIEALFPDTIDPQEFDWHAAMIDSARDAHGADAILPLDPDERLLIPGDVHALEPQPDGVTIPRLNTIWPDPVSCAAAARRPLQPDEVPLVFQPVAVPDELRYVTPSIPWVLQGLKPRIVVRWQDDLGFMVGNHAATYGDEIVDAPTGGGRRAAVVAHLPFTTYERFRNKVERVVPLVERHRERFGSDSAWHWRRWVLIREQDEAALLDEFLEQFMSPAEVATLLGSPAVAMAGDILRELGRASDDA